MGISMTVQNYLDDLGVDYTSLAHYHTETSSMTAEASHVQDSRLVKAVIVRDGDGYLMALLPASHHLRLQELEDVVGRDVDLATEKELMTLFDDCEPGAVPALGMAYGLDVVVEDSLIKSGDVFFEGGDHETLVQIEAKAFENLLGNVTHGHFSHQVKMLESRDGTSYSNA